MNARRAAAALASVASAACSLGGPEVLPLRGPTPRTVVVLPVRGPLDPEPAAVLAETLVVALAERGYQMLPFDQGVARMRAAGIDPGRIEAAEDLARAARAAGADAFFSLRADLWHPLFADSLVELDYALSDSLWSAADASLLWELQARDHWSWRDDATVFIGHETAFEAAEQMAERRRPQSPYHSERDAALAVHRRVLLHLPRR